MYDFSQGTIEQALPQIQKLRAVEDAWYDTLYGGLIVRTRAGVLRHRLSFLPLARIEFRISRGNLGLRYVSPFSKWVHWHPTIDKKIEHEQMVYRCLGDYPEDTREIWGKQGPLYGVLYVLAMLQGIRAEKSSDLLDDWIHVPFICISLFLAGFIVLLLLRAAITNI